MVILSTDLQASWHSPEQRTGPAHSHYKPVTLFASQFIIDHASYISNIFVVMQFKINGNYHR